MHPEGEKRRWGELGGWGGHIHTPMYKVDN